MDIHTYLRYNNVALIDPEVPFHASCIKQFGTKGYLTISQLASLRGWSHSQEAIARIVASIPTEPLVQAVEPVTSKPAVKRTKWTDDELKELLTLVIDDGVKDVTSLAATVNRTMLAVKSTLYKYTHCSIKDNIIKYCYKGTTEEIPF